MDINRSKLPIVSLFTITIFSWFLLLSANAASRGMSVISDLSHQSGKLGSYRALLIGINDYNDPKIPDLETAVNDATATAKLLQERYGFKVKLLLDRKATKKAIYQALRNLASSTIPDDNILIYYAGHGDLDRLTNDGWWIPSDATGGDPVTYLNNFLVQTYMRSMKARHVLLISDSCYSGTLFGQARAMPQIIENKYYLNLYNEKSRWGMTSGNKTPVSDLGSHGHSVFAYQLLKELRNNEKPYVSTQEIYTRIASIVGNNSEQTPICRPIRNTGDQGGEFIFVASDVTMTDVAADTKLTTEHKRLEQKRTELEKIKDELRRLEAERKFLEEKKPLDAEYLRLENEKKALQDKLEKTQSKQLAYIPQVYSKVQSGSHHALAFFPSNTFHNSEIWCSFAHEIVYRSAIKAINEVALKQPKIALRYSYYTGHSSTDKEIINRLGVEIIDKLFDKEALNKLWARKSSFAHYEPDISTVMKFAKKINADVILMYRYGWNSFNEDNPIYVYLIDTKTDGIYIASEFADVDRADKIIKEITKRVLEDFLRKYSGG